MPETVWIYGVNPVLEVLRARPQGVRHLRIARGRMDKRTLEVISLAKERGIALRFLGRRELDENVGRAFHQGVAAEVSLPGYVPMETLVTEAGLKGEPALLVALDEVQDPQNLGSLTRTAEVFGAHGLIIERDRACGITPAVYKASAGAVEHIPVARVVNLARALAELKEKGVWAVGADAEEGISPSSFDLCQPIVLVFGAEGRGLRRLVKERCDVRVSIATRGKVASLNVAAAAAAILYEVSKQRGLGEKQKNFLIHRKKGDNN